MLFLLELRGIKKKKKLLREPNHFRKVGNVNVTRFYCALSNFPWKKNQGLFNLKIMYFVLLNCQKGIRETVELTRTVQP